MNANKILWADDEIDLLKPHIMFLTARGYDLTTVNNGRDAIDLVADGNHFDLIILDENMPGLTGLETLQQLKMMAPTTPIIMITKSEEENIMDQAVGNNIADYLIKPVNPNQILLSIKKNLHGGTLVARQATADYQQQFQAIAGEIATASTLTDWMALYDKIVKWELKLTQADTDMAPMLEMQRREAEGEFFKFVKSNYASWLQGDAVDRPLMSDTLMQRVVLPQLDAMTDDSAPLYFLLIDNFRLDQWQTVKPLLSEYFTFEEQLYTTILPTATQYARNAIFSGLMPGRIAKMFPDLWVDEDEEEGKNLNESPMVETLLQRFRRQCRFSYNKIYDSQGCDRMLKGLSNLKGNKLNIIVINFIDMLSHARTESKMIRELASNDPAYRSITESWFRHSSILDLFKAIAAQGSRIIVTTDHGTIRVDRPVKIIGDKNTNTNLRYKIGRSLNYQAKQVMEIKDPEAVGLPRPNVASAYVLAGRDDFFAYPNNYNYYVQYYTGTFQHGGVSMEEMLVPLVTLSPK
ncbi:MAG: PglZ domain-containing protein [Muribaculaceae bacterium]|nr:PglZ domain-containing protein [Muribaculaceae bacterium]